MVPGAVDVPEAVPKAVPKAVEAEVPGPAVPKAVPAPVAQAFEVQGRASLLFRRLVSPKRLRRPRGFENHGVFYGFEGEIAGSDLNTP